MRQPTDTRSAVRLSLFLCLFVSCGRPEPAADVAAVLADKELPYAEFEVYLAENAIADAPSLDGAVLSSLFDQFLEELLLTRLAADEGFDTEAARVAVRRLISEAAGEVEAGEAEAYYRANPDRFRQAEAVRLRQVLVEERALAEQALRELADGAAFEDVARRLSQGPRAEVGGDQGMLMRGDLPPEIADRIFALEQGRPSEIIEVAYGFHIFEVAERFPETTATFDAAYQDIVEVLQEERRVRASRELLQQAVKRYNVEVFERNLPFRYQGKYG